MSELARNAVLEQIKFSRLNSQEDKLEDDTDASFMRESQSRAGTWRRHTIDAAASVKRLRSDAPSISSLTSGNPYTSLKPGWNISDYESAKARDAQPRRSAAQKNIGINEGCDTIKNYVRDSGSH